MQKIFAYSVLAATCVAAFSGCSTSRGGDTTDSSKYLTEKPSIKKPQSTPTNTESPVADSGSTATTAFTKNLFIASEQGPLVGAILTFKADKIENQNPLNDGKEKLSELVLGDTRIILFNTYDLYNGNGIDGFKTLSNKDIATETPTDKKLTGYVGGFGEEANYNPEYFRNMRFGVVNLGSESSLFVQGYQTPDQASGPISALNGQHYPIPKDGKFLYNKGYALYGKAGKYDQLNAEVVADFSEKRLDVRLTQQDKDRLAFSAKIEGNTFSGSQNGIETKGAFYGSLAAEVGGVFYQTEGADKGKNGVFGAVDKRKIQ